MPSASNLHLSPVSSLTDKAKPYFDALKANNTVENQRHLILSLEHLYELERYAKFEQNLQKKSFKDNNAPSRTISIFNFVVARMALLSAPWDDNLINRFYLTIWTEIARKIYAPRELYSGAPFDTSGTLGSVNLDLLFRQLNAHKNLDFKVPSAFREINYYSDQILPAIQQRLEEDPQDIRVRHIVSAKQWPSICKAFLVKLLHDLTNLLRSSESLESFIQVMLSFFEESFGKDKARAIVLEASLMSLALRAKCKPGKEVELNKNDISRIAQLLDRSKLFADAKELGSKFLTRLTVDSLRLILEELEHKSTSWVETEKSYYSDFLFSVIKQMSQNDSTLPSAELVRFITTVAVNDAKEVETKTALAAAKASPSTTAETAATTSVIQVAENAANTLKIIDRVKQAGLLSDETIASNIADLEKAEDTARIVKQNNHVKRALLFIRRVCASELNVKSEIKKAVSAQRQVTNSIQESIQQFAGLKDAIKGINTSLAKVFLDLLELIESPEFPFKHVSFEKGIYLHKALHSFRSRISSQARLLAFKATLLFHQIDFMSSLVAKTNIYGFRIFRDVNLQQVITATFEKVNTSTKLDEQTDRIEGTKTSVAELAKLMFDKLSFSDSGRHSAMKETLYPNPF